MAKANDIRVLKYGILTAGLLLAAAACSVPSESSSGAVTESTAVAPPEVEVVTVYEGDVMDMPLDGSSLEAFDASLAVVKQNTSEENYESLNDALDYLMMFDIGVRNDRARLAARLNGQNSYEVIARVDALKPATWKKRSKKNAGGT